MIITRSCKFESPESRTRILELREIGSFPLHHIPLQKGAIIKPWLRLFWKNHWLFIVKPACEVHCWHKRWNAQECETKVVCTRVVTVELWKWNQSGQWHIDLQIQLTQGEVLLPIPIRPPGFTKKTPVSPTLEPASKNKTPPHNVVCLQNTQVVVRRVLVGVKTCCWSEYSGDWGIWDLDKHGRGTGVDGQQH